MPRDASEDRSLDDACCLKPVRDCQPHPIWETDIAHLPTFTAKAYESPLPVTLLNCGNLELDKFPTPQGRGEENCQDRVIPLTADCTPVDGAQNVIHFVLQEPVAKSGPSLLFTANPSNRGSFALVSEAPRLRPPERRHGQRPDAGSLWRVSRAAIPPSLASAF